MAQHTDSNVIRNELVEAILSHYEGSDVKCEVENVQRNAFCIRLDGGPIFTVTTTYGGALTRWARNEEALTKAFGPPGSVTKVELPDERLTLKDNDVIKVVGARYSRQRLGTVSGSAREYRENETAAIDKAQERGHKLVWLNAEATVIAADPSSVDRSFVAEVTPGQQIYIDSEHAEERGVYTVELPRPRHLDGDSCRLVRVED